MSRHVLNADQTLYAIRRIISDDDSHEIIVSFAKDSELFKNSLNLKVMQMLADANGKSLKFESEDAKYKDYMDSVNGDNLQFAEDEVNLDMDEVIAPIDSRSKEGSKLNFNPFGFLAIRPSMPGSRAWMKIVLIPLAVLLLVGGAMFAAWWYIPTAVIKMTVDSKGLIKLVDVKASTDQTDVSVETLTIPAIKIDVAETDSQTIPTTGKKLTGEKATGTVMITNKTTNEVEIAKGATVKLISSDKENLLYETTEAITVDAAVENVDGTGTTYGKKEVKVSATQFGDKYNLDDGETFEIDDHDNDDVVATNESSISGGTSEEINVVTQTDLDKLRKDLEEFMIGKSESSLRRKLVGAQVLQASSIDMKVDSAEFSKKLDEEADDLTLTMNVTASALAYDDDTLRELMKEVVKTVVPESFALDSENPDYEVAATKSDSPTVLNLQVKLNSSITPKLNVEKIKEDVAGMNIDQAQTYLDEVNDVKSFEIVISPNLPGVLLRMPQRAENIEIEVSK